MTEYTNEIELAFQNVRNAYGCFVNNNNETISETIDEINSSAYMLMDAFQYELPASGVAIYRARLDNYINEFVSSVQEPTILEEYFVLTAQRLYAATHDAYFDLPGAAEAFRSMSVD